jgi:hypothetical protein
LPAKPATNPPRSPSRPSPSARPSPPSTRRAWRCLVVGCRGRWFLRVVPNLDVFRSGSVKHVGIGLWSNFRPIAPRTIRDNNKKGRPSCPERPSLGRKRPRRAPVARRNGAGDRVRTAAAAADWHHYRVPFVIQLRSMKITNSPPSRAAL